MSKKVRKAIFPVGGLGTRFLPATKAIPKEMLPVASKPLIQYAFEEAVEAGIEEFIFVTGRNKSAINNHFDHAFELQSVLSDKEKHDTLAKVSDWTPRSGQIAFIPQREPLGLGHAIWCARNLIEKDEYFAVLLADEMVLAEKSLLAQMVDIHQEHEGNIVAVGEVPLEDTSKYGIIDTDTPGTEVMKINAMVEKPAPEDAPSRYSISGRYILHADIFEHLGNARKTQNQEIQLTDSMQAMLSNSDFYGYRFYGDRYDCGSQTGFLEANIGYALAHGDSHNKTAESIKKFYDRLTQDNLKKERA